jgi:hypothetical protein
MLCACSAHEHGSALPRPVTVRFAGAVPAAAVHLEYFRNSGLRLALNARTPSFDSSVS